VGVKGLRSVSPDTNERDMSSHSAVRLLGRPVLLHEEQLGRVVDLMLDVDRTRVLGFVVDGDEQRFLPFAAAQVGSGEVAVASALMLLDDIGFYRKRGVSFRSLLGTDVGGGRLADARIGRGGDVVELERTATAA
jgi:sporulation protein YlmC with PRC-barrel domain